MSFIQTEDDRIAARLYLRECIFIITEAIETMMVKAVNETHRTAAEDIEADIAELKADLHVVVNKHDGLAHLRPGARLTRPPKEKVDALMELVQRVNSETQDARKAALILDIVDETIALAGEVKRLRSSAA
jgi:hypothetical protein